MGTKIRVGLTLMGAILLAACTAKFKPAPTGGATQGSSSVAGPSPTPQPTPTPGPTPAPTPLPSGAAGCGLTSAAFCDTFDSGPAAVKGRAGDLDASKWTAGRVSPDGFSAPGLANPVQAAPIPACKAGQTATVYPPFDTLICDPDSKGNRQLMTAVMVQNYGINSYMIQQPFDFAGRTGKIVFDVDAATDGGLGSFVTVDITEDPVHAPTFQEFHNNESGAIPRNAIMLKWNDDCGAQRNTVKVGNVLTYNNYVMTLITTPTFQVARDACPKTKKGSLNHIEIQLSQSKVEVYMSDFSPDGTSMPNMRLIHSANISLPFTRGYVHFAARNHAGQKYADGFGTDPVGIFHWDNIAFDGPVVSGNRFYSVADNTTAGTKDGHAIMNLGYGLRDGTTGVPAGIYNPNTILAAPLQINGVNTAGATKARLTLNAYFAAFHTATETWGLKYRLNGGTWSTRTLNATEVLVINDKYVNPDPGVNGSFMLVMDVPFADVKNGVNTLEVLPVNAPMDYIPTIANIDLILTP